MPAATSSRASSQGLPPTLVGLPEPNPSDEGRPLFNTAALARRRPRRPALSQGAAADLRRLRRGPLLRAVPRRADPRASAGRRLGISICEDIWNDRDFWKRRRYHHDPVEELVRAGAQAIVNLSASPFSAGKHAPPRGDARQHGAPSTACRSSYVNQFGGNDDLVFDGRSCAFGADGRADRARPLVRPPTSSCAISAATGAIGPASDLDVESEIWRALVLGTRDYARKCGFSRVVLGLSGGIDSALTAAIAVEALGADHVLGVLMPSPFSSRGSDRRLARAGRAARHRDADAADRRRDAGDGTTRSPTRSPARRAT